MQDTPRIYVPSSAGKAEPGRLVELQAAHIRYLVTVLRLREGDPLRIFNEFDGEWEASLLPFRKSGGAATLIRCLRPGAGRESNARCVSLLFAPLKRDATDLVIRMGTELGVSCFIPILTERSNTHRVNTGRWRAIATEAAEQCERLGVPEIKTLTPLKVALAQWDDQVPLYVAVERFDETRQRKVSLPYGLLVGPEGGFSAPERDLLIGQPYTHPISLSPTILRADTAVATALAQLAFLVRQFV